MVIAVKIVFMRYHGVAIGMSYIVTLLPFNEKRTSQHVENMPMQFLGCKKVTKI